MNRVLVNVTILPEIKEIETLSVPLDNKLFPLNQLTSMVMSLSNAVLSLMMQVTDILVPTNKMAPGISRVTLGFETAC